MGLAKRGFFSGTGESKGKRAKMKMKEKTDENERSGKTEQKPNREKSLKKVWKKS